MKLTFEQIKSAAWGAVRVEEENGNIRFCRFTKEQQDIYEGYNKDFHNKTFATAGVKLVFKTNSKNLTFKAALSKSIRGSSRAYYSFDVFADGKMIGSINNHENVDIPDNYASIVLQFDKAEKTFDLGDGEKTVKIYFPWSMCAILEEISIDDGASFDPIKPAKKLIAFGDSITHGYDALYSSNRYPAKLAEALDAEEINKGIGGEIFFPSLAESADDFAPDYITVAYGTNDWSHRNKKEFIKNCRAFYAALSKNYPDTKIFAITPIWRKDCGEMRDFGKFEDIEKCIAECVADLENVTLIRGFDLVPKDSEYFADLRLHPNDKGFDYYYKNLLAEIKKHL